MLYFIRRLDYAVEDPSSIQEITFPTILFPRWGIDLSGVQHVQRSTVLRHQSGALQQTLDLVQLTQSDARRSTSTRIRRCFC